MTFDEVFDYVYKLLVVFIPLCSALGVAYIGVQNKANKKATGEAKEIAQDVEHKLDDMYKHNINVAETRMQKEKFEYLLQSASWDLLLGIAYAVKNGKANGELSRGIDRFEKQRNEFRDKNLDLNILMSEHYGKKYDI